MTKAVYSWAVVDGVICVTDENGPRSVTNDAEAVIADLARKGVDLASMPVVYRDTEGTWDQLVVEDGRFDGFRLLGEEDRDRAVARAKEYMPTLNASVGKPEAKMSLVLQWAAERLSRAAATSRGSAGKNPGWRSVHEGVAQQIQDRADQVQSWATGAKWREDRGEETPPDHIAYVRSATREFLITGGFRDAAEQSRTDTPRPIGSLEELKAVACRWALVNPEPDAKHPDDAAKLAQNVEAAQAVCGRWAVDDDALLEARPYLDILEAARGELDAAIALHSQTPRWQRRFEQVRGDLATTMEPQSEEPALTVCRSAAGYYLGTLTPDGHPNSRESAEYWDRKEDAEAALTGQKPWTPRNAVEQSPPALKDKITGLFAQSAAQHLSALNAAGPDEAAFGAAFSQLTADDSITTREAVLIAGAYTGEDGGWETREAALGRIETEFYARGEEQAQEQAQGHGR